MAVEEVLIRCLFCQASITIRPDIVGDNAPSRDVLSVIDSMAYSKGWRYRGERMTCHECSKGVSYGR